MSLSVERAAFFIADFDKQFAWYVDKAGEVLAWNFQVALDKSLMKLANRPDLGRLRRFRHAKLQGLRSYPVDGPFAKLLIFYRVEKDILLAFRLMHGARDLPHRLVEPPGSSAE
jgi:plasmid stabilization system protein ParE